MARKMNISDTMTPNKHTNMKNKFVGQIGNMKTCRNCGLTPDQHLRVDVFDIEYVLCPSRDNHYDQ